VTSEQTLIPGASIPMEHGDTSTNIELKDSMKNVRPSNTIWYDRRV